VEKEIKAIVALVIVLLVFFGFLLRHDIQASNACLARGGVVIGKSVSGGGGVIVGHLITSSPIIYAITLKDTSGKSCNVLIEEEQYATIERGDTIKGVH
jgi:hypothetical protein